MGPADELDLLVKDLIDDPSYAEGRRHARRTTPPEVVEVLHDLYRAHTSAAGHLPVVAEELGHVIACRRGCFECCHELIGVTYGEAFCIATWLAEGEQADLRARVVTRARAWVAAAGTRPAEALDCARDGDDAGHGALRRAHAQARLLCPANEDGACAIYDVRPLTCRLPYVVDTAAHCAPRSPPGPPAQLISSEAYERFKALARRLVSGLEGTLGHDPRARLPLPPALLAAIEALDRSR